MKKIIRSSFRASTAVLLLLTLATGLATSTPGAAEASPAPVLRALPNASDSLFVMPCGSSGFPTTAGLVDVATGAITGRGGPVVSGACFNNGDYDATTKTSYVIDFTGATRILSTFDPLTGVVTPIAEFFEGSPTNLRNPLALAISATGRPMPAETITSSTG